MLTLNITFLMFMPDKKFYLLFRNTATNDIYLSNIKQN